MPVVQGPFGSANNVTTTSAGTFIPQQWSLEINTSYKKKLVGLLMFRKMAFEGAGNIINIPSPVRGVAVSKAANTLVTIQQATEGNVPITINRHFHYARVIEDIVKVQGLPSLRRFYTEDAGYSLARNQESDLFAASAFLNTGSGTLAFTAGFVGGNGTTLYTSGAPNATDITDVGIRRSIQRLDENDLPGDDRCLILTPGQKNIVMGINRYTEQAFVGEVGGNNVIRSGVLGNLYGLNVAVSNNLPTATGGARVNIIGHRDALVMATQMDIRVQTQYKLEYLGDLMVADILYGTRAYMAGTPDVPTAGFTLVTPT
jgi:hypothetical protein